jgi:uncharacterized heparinase superfamily protein
MRVSLDRQARMWHTVRHLRLRQVVGRLQRHLRSVRPDLAPAPPVRAMRGPWVAPAQRPSRVRDGSEFEFMGLQRNVFDVRWDPPEMPKLWRYNLHYFDDVGSPDAARTFDDLIRLMVRWVNDNPPGVGTGWEPYPCSQRIVNWSKWLLAGHQFPEGCAHSLAVQTRWLSKHVEHHLFGNHLFLNGKALLFAGSVFEGPEADSWARMGARILAAELPEQILADGGQFERSPMYHALALEDVLDLVNLRRAIGARADHPVNDVADECERRASGMRHWLRVMTHPDGEVSFFNDAAMGVAPTMAELDAYAGRLGMQRPEPLGDGIVLLQASGYARMQHGDAVVIMDVAPLGPDYLPGHGHADTLSIELSVAGRRLLVNSGTSTYEWGPERLRQRGTAAHNTVVLGEANSSDVWGSFRVGRRARPFGLEVGSGPDGLSVTCSHDGYAYGRRPAVHTRHVRLLNRELKVLDSFPPGMDAEARWHLAPGLRLEPLTGRLLATSVEVARIESWPGLLKSLPSSWHPQFGVDVPSAVLSCPSCCGSLGLGLRW